MKIPSAPFFERFFPFLIWGILIVLLSGFLVVFFYLFVWGLMIGFILWAAAWFKQTFFSNEESPQVLDKKDKIQIIRSKDIHDK